MKANVPILRFKGDHGDEFPVWEAKPLDEVFERIKSKNTENNRNILTISAQDGLINQEEYFKKSIASKDASNYFLLKKGDFAYNKSYSKGYPMGAIKRLTRYETGVVSPLYICFRSKVAVSASFFAFYFMAGVFNRQIASIAQEGVRNHGLLNVSVVEFFRDLELHTPTLPEQRKIAKFLMAMDGRIQQLIQEKALLEDYKKGVMQQLLTQEIRFKDDQGNVFPDWEEKKLKAVAKIYDGTHTTPAYTETGVPFYSVEHLTRGCFQQTKFISKEVFEKENKRVKLERGDVLMTRIGDIGTSRHLDWDVRASFYVSLALIKLQRDRVISEFAHQSILASYFQRELWQRTIHVAFPKKINLGEIGECRIKLPTIEEQTKIADFLSAVDRKIKSVATQITETQTFKKGLLQQMFV